MYIGEALHSNHQDNHEGIKGTMKITMYQQITSFQAMAMLRGYLTRVAISERKRRIGNFRHSP